MHACSVYMQVQAARQATLHRHSFQPARAEDPTLQCGRLQCLHLVNHSSRVGVHHMVNLPIQVFQLHMALPGPGASCRSDCRDIFLNLVLCLFHLCCHFICEPCLVRGLTITAVWHLMFESCESRHHFTACCSLRCLLLFAIANQLLKANVSFS